MENERKSERKDNLLLQKSVIDYYCDEEIKPLIEQGLDVDSRDKEGMTPLALGACIGDAEFVKFLLNHGANANLKYRNEVSPLEIAISSSRFDNIALILIENGADVNEVSCSEKNCGKTPLMLAITERYENVARALINKGADVNAVDNDGKTVLMYAVKNAYIELVLELINKGSDVNAVDKEGMTPLLYAADRSIGHDMEIFNDPDLTKMELIQKIIYEEKVARPKKGKEIVKILVENGADVNAANNEGITALMYVLVDDTTWLAEFLIENGADVNARTKDLVPAIMIPVYKKSLKSTELFIKHGADVNAADREGTTSLEVAISQNSKEIAELLIRNGAKL